MRLDRCILRPGIVLKVMDNKGTIKAEAPGLFPREDNTDLMPPIYPATFLFNTNGFTTPVEGDEVWIMNFEDNLQQLYWLRKDSLDDDKKLLVDEEGKIDVILNRDSGKGWGTMYFSDGSGWVISRDKSKINIKANGDIEISHPNTKRTIYIDGRGIHLGKKDATHTATFADQLIPILYDIANQMFRIKLGMSLNPYTAPVANLFDPKWENKINSIESKNVKLE